MSENPSQSWAYAPDHMKFAQEVINIPSSEVPPSNSPLGICINWGDYELTNRYALLAASAIGFLFRRVSIEIDGFHWFRLVRFHYQGHPSILQKGHLQWMDEILHQETLE